MNKVQGYIISLDFFNDKNETVGTKFCNVTYVVCFLYKSVGVFLITKMKLIIVCVIKYKRFITWIFSVRYSIYLC